MKKSPIERLTETHSQMEIWWDSSPLIYASWAEGFVKKAAPDRAKDLKEALLRLFDSDHPEKSLFRGVTTNPPLSLAVLKTHGSAWERVVDGLIEKNPCVDKESLFWLTYKEIVRQGAEMYRGLFEQSRYRYGYLSGQVDPRALYNKEKMISQALELAGLGPNVMVKVPGTKEGYEVIRFLTSKGISTNNTLTFVLPQLMACAHAVKEGLEIARQNGVDLTRWRSVITHMTARYGDLGDLRKRESPWACLFRRRMSGGQSWPSSRRRTGFSRSGGTPARCSSVRCGSARSWMGKSTAGTWRNWREGTS